jgi:protein TonB
MFFSVGLIAALSMSLLAFEFRTFSVEVIVPDFPDFEDTEEELIPITMREKKVPPPPQPKPAKPQPEVKAPVVQVEKTIEAVSLETPNFDSLLAELPPEKPVEEDLRIYNVPQKSAEYPGGIPALYAYMRKFKPTSMFKEYGGEGGTMHVTWVVEKDGSISNVEVLRGLGYGMDEGIVRHVKGMEMWLPALQGDRKVRQRFHLPLNYSLQ